jgi:hypothetical protein
LSVFSRTWTEGGDDFFMASANGQGFFLYNNPSSRIIQNKYHVNQHCADLDDVLIRCFSNKDYNFVPNIFFQNAI